MMNKHLIAGLGLLLGLSVCGLAENKPPAAPIWLPASAEKLPRWRGFNLLEKFNARHDPFKEEDFQIISKLGFNFVRLPMDYRIWIKNGDWAQFDESQLKEVDQAVEWGRKYGIHVCINFHRAPGYTVAKPPEPTSVWTDAATQEACANHWVTFAKRYKGIPSTQLSFDLFNEPANIETNSFVDVIRKLTEAIHAADPDRLIISDGLNWGNKPVPELAGVKVAQATRGYAPMQISHYKASWVNGERFGLPSWPLPQPPPGTLHAPRPEKPAQALEITGSFAAATTLRVHVNVVSHSATLVAEADGVKLWDHHFECGPGEGEWKKSEFKEQWKIYQNLYDRDYKVTIPAETKQVRLVLSDGDWLQVGEIGLKVADAPGASEDVLALESAWGKPPAQVTYTPGKSSGAFSGMVVLDRDRLWKDHIEPWKQLEAMGFGVFVGEWGAFNKTPHAVTLAWMEDCLANWQKAGWGWALWNFRGSFGVMDSGRTDVTYEEFEGHKLDRKMLELLQKY